MWSLKPTLSSVSPLRGIQGKLIQNPNAGILQQCFFSDHNNKKESQMGFKAQNTVLNPKRQCADWANQTLDSNFKRRPRGVSWQEKAFDPLNCFCASDTTRDENWWQNLWIRVSMCKRVSHLPQEEMMSTVMQFPAHIATVTPCSPWSVPMSTATHPYYLLLICITVMTTTASYQFPSLRTALSQASNQFLLLLYQALKWRFPCDQVQELACPTQVCQYVHVRLETCQDFISFESEGGSCVHNQPQ
jgi:hypothetical protein